jgi:pimeloyl-ACP methyl ester carboxylesterase
VACCSSVASYIDKLPSISKLNPDSIYTSQWLELDRGKIRYIRRGDPKAKDTVILMPDPPNTIEHMEELIKILEPTFQVIAFEGMGFGYSTAFPSHDFSLEHCADVIVELLKKLEINRAILALTCIAALPGLMVAKKNPDIITGLVLGQTPSLSEAKKWANRVDFKGLLGTPFVGQILLRLLRNRVSDIWYKNALARDEDRSPYVEKTLSSFRRGARFSLASALQSFQRDKTSSSELVAEQNAIVLWGSLDRGHKKTDKHSILDFLPNGKIIELENCAHFPDIEAPEEFAKAICDIAAADSSNKALQRTIR